MADKQEEIQKEILSRQREEKRRLERAKQEQVRDERARADLDLESAKEALR